MVVDGSPSSGPAAPRPYRTVALIIACALFMEQMDATILATALPTMARSFRAPVTSLSSALTAYLLALAIFIPASGRLADRFGSKTIFRAAIVLFVVGSVLCGVSPNLPFLVAARFVQGVGGAMMIPVGRLVVLRRVAKEDMVQAMSWVIMPAMIGPVIGPPVGGLIITYLDWRWIFYLNVPVGIVGVILASRYIDQIRNERPPRFDLIGFLLSGISLSCLLFGFQTMSQSGRYWRAAELIIAGLISGAIYIRHASRRQDPILDLSLLAVPTFRLSVIAGSLTRIGLGALPFLLPLLFQLGFGMSPAASGSITMAPAIGSICMKWFAPLILRRVGFRLSLTVNGLLASFGYALCGFFRPNWPTAAIWAVLAISGFFMSVQFSAYNTIAYDEIPPDRMSAATSFYATIQELMLSLGICFGVLALHLSMLRSGHLDPAITDFTAAFLLVMGVCALATVWHLQLSKQAGHGVVARPSDGSLDSLGSA